MRFTLIAIGISASGERTVLGVDVAAAGASLQLPIYADENAVKGDSGLAQFGLALVTSGAKLALCNGQSSKFVPLS